MKENNFLRVEFEYLEPLLIPVEFEAKKDIIIEAYKYIAEVVDDICIEGYYANSLGSEGWRLVQITAKEADIEGYTTIGDAEFSNERLYKCSLYNKKMGGWFDENDYEEVYFIPGTILDFT